MARMRKASSPDRSWLLGIDDVGAGAGGGGALECAGGGAEAGGA